MIKELRSLLDTTDNKLIDDFLQVATDINLSDENKIEGLLYHLLCREKITTDTIEEQYASHYDTVKCLLKLDNIN